MTAASTASWTMVTRSDPLPGTHCTHHGIAGEPDRPEERRYRTQPLLRPQDDHQTALITSGSMSVSPHSRVGIHGHHLAGWAR